MHTIPASPNSYCSHNERLPATPPKSPNRKKTSIRLAASAGPPLAGAVLCATGFADAGPGREGRTRVRET
jgi:hypothetical protein